MIRYLLRVRFPRIHYRCVTLDELDSEQIADHIRSGTWQDKAGAYAIQENGDEFVEKIDGSMTNVMGLPMELVQRMFAGIGSKYPFQ